MDCLIHILEDHSGEFPGSPVVRPRATAEDPGSIPLVGEIRSHKWLKMCGAEKKSLWAAVLRMLWGKREAGVLGGCYNSSGKI